MRDPDEFDAFYAATRDPLLAQTLAVSGDLVSAHAAVRDAYVVAWHRWRRVGRLPHPSAWVRRRAWSHARGRHPGRLRGVDDPGARATLEALLTLTADQRGTLALHHLSALPLADLAAESGRSRAEAESTLAAATRLYAAHRGADPDAAGRELAGLSRVTDDVRWPRASAVRHRGQARRRTYAVLGVAASIAVLAGAGVVLTDRVDAPDLADSRLPGGSAGGDSSGGGGSSASGVTSSDPTSPGLSADQLLDDAAVARLDPDRRWAVVAGDGGSSGDLACPTATTADPQTVDGAVGGAVGGVVRTFAGRAFAGQSPSQAPVTAVQALGLSASVEAAGRAFVTTLGRYAGCASPRTTLVHTWSVGRVGDQATVVTLRQWGRDPAVLTVGVARTGEAVTTVVRRATGSDAAARQLDVARVLGLAVGHLCGDPGAGTCAGTPVLRASAPPPLPASDGLLDTVDLPQPGTAVGTWSGTEPTGAGSTPAVIACDDSDFSRAPVRAGVTRTFVMLHAALPDSFGLTENAGRLASPAAARTFVSRVRDRFDTCQRRDLGSTVVSLARGSDLAAWRVTTKIDDTTTVQVLTAVVRRGDRVAQLGLVVAPAAGYDASAFLDVATRAADRLTTLTSTP